MASKTFRANDDKIISDSGGRANETVVNLSKKNKSKNLICIPNIKVIGERTFLISNAKKTFNYLQLVFIKAPIFRRFNLKSHIYIKIDASSYAINRMLS